MNRTLKFKTVCVALLLMLTVACQFAARGDGSYNYGDWNSTNTAQWWWKYVRKIHPQWGDVIKPSEAFVWKEVVDLRTQDASNAVTFTFKNTSLQTVSYQGSIYLRHTIVTADGSVLYSEALAKALLPAALKPGESFQVRGTAFTPSKLRGMTHVMEMETY